MVGLGIAATTFAPTKYLYSDLSFVEVVKVTTGRHKDFARQMDSLFLHSIVAIAIVTAATTNSILDFAS